MGHFKNPSMIRILAACHLGKGAGANRQKFCDKNRDQHGNTKPVWFGSGIPEFLPNPDSLNSVSKKCGPLYTFSGSLEFTTKASISALAPSRAKLVLSCILHTIPKLRGMPYISPRKETVLRFEKR